MSNNKVCKNNKKHTKDIKRLEKAKIITEKRRIGNLGEDIACTFLQKQGYVIADRNYLRKYGEIDIVAVKQGNYHFIEVKTVTSYYAKASQDKREESKSVTHETPTDSYRAEDNIHPWKLKRLARVIQTYIIEKQIGENWQFDVMTVVLNMKTRRARVEFIENIVL